MKTYFLVSDIHNEYDALVEGLLQAGFDEFNDEHILFSVGDLLDRGSQAVEVLDFVIKLWEKGKFIGILGNHDNFIKEYFSFPIRSEFDINHNGFNTTLRQLSGTYFGNFNLVEESVIVRKAILKRFPKILEFYNSLVDIVEMGEFVITHAGYSQIPAGSDLWYVDNWARTDFFVKDFIPVDKTYIFGHWHGYKLNNLMGYTSKPGDIFLAEGFIGIDACSNASKKVIVVTLKETEEGFDIYVPRWSVSEDFISIITEEGK